MLEAGISSTALISRFWGIVPEQADRDSAASPCASAAPVGIRAETAAASPHRANISDTIETALRSAGLMR
jgi:hypothetical protein